MKFRYYLIPLLLLGSPASASSLYVFDGDTVRIGRETVRILNIDTPEIRDFKCDRELKAGFAAKERLMELLGQGKIDLKRGDGGRRYDTHGRTLARVFVNGRDIGEIMIAEGHARPWTGRRRSWCH